MQPVEAMKDAILADVNTFSGGHFDDDATLIVVGIP
jgi:serine phosphatase RsbU (regulator of sigma subunit)